MDKGHAFADKEINKIQYQLSVVYDVAEAKAEKVLLGYLAKFDKIDADMQAKVQDGTLTETQYKQWRVSKMLNTREYRKVRRRISEIFEEADQQANSIIEKQLPEIYWYNYSLMAREILQNVQKIYQARAQN